MVEMFEQVRSRFSVDEQRHYLFTPRDLTAWIVGLLRYDMTAEALLDVIAHEAQRTFRDRLVDSESENKFDGVVVSLLQRQWKHGVNFDGIVYTALGIGGGSHGTKSAAGGAGGESKTDSGAGAGDQGVGDGLQVNNAPFYHFAVRICVNFLVYLQFIFRFFTFSDFVRMLFSSALRLLLGLMSSLDSFYFFISPSIRWFSPNGLFA